MATATELRQNRGKEICMMQNAVMKENETDYIVKSQSGNGEYRVSQTFKGFVCSCPDNTYRGWTCKHIFAVQFSFNLKQIVKREITLEPISNVSQCQFCGSSKLRKYGVRRNKSGDIQRYLCEFCKRTFSINIGFEHMRHNPQAVTTAMQLYFSGESLRNTQKTLRFLGVKVSHKTVFYWIRKYVAIMEKYANKISPGVSDVWRADEIYMKIGGKQKYLFAVMDDETRYLIAQEVAQTKEQHNAKSLFRNARSMMRKAPIRLITDGLGSYQNAFESELKTPGRLNEHIQEIAFNGEIHNNKNERLNGEIRDREKTMRGLKHDETPILTGYQIYHNFIREHEALGNKTPGEACGIKINGENKWKTLIQNASIKEPRGILQPKGNTNNLESFL